jgi:hypothetical protein
MIIFQEMTYIYDKIALLSRGQPQNHHNILQCLIYNGFYDNTCVITVYQFFNKGMLMPSMPANIDYW